MVFSTDLEQVNAFCESASLNKTDWPYVKRRENGQTYGNILITSKGHDFADPWKTWWEDYIGLEVFCILEFETCRYTGKTFIKEAHPVRLTRTRMNHGRGIPASAFSLV